MKKKVRTQGFSAKESDDEAVRPVPEKLNAGGADQIVGAKSELTVKHRKSFVNEEATRRVYGPGERFHRFTQLTEADGKPTPLGTHQDAKDGKSKDDDPALGFYWISEAEYLRIARESTDHPRFAGPDTFERDIRDPLAIATWQENLNHTHVMTVPEGQKIAGFEGLIAPQWENVGPGKGPGGGSHLRYPGGGKQVVFEVVPDKWIENRHIETRVERKDLDRRPQRDTGDEGWIPAAQAIREARAGKQPEEPKNQMDEVAQRCDWKSKLSERGGKASSGDKAREEQKTEAGKKPDAPEK